MVSSSLTPFLEHPLVSITEVEKVIASVVTLLHQAAAATIPASSHKSRIKNFIHDEKLKQKCQASESAWRSWQNANRPRSGPLYEQMKTTKNEVKSHVRNVEQNRTGKPFKPEMTCSEARMSDVSTYNDERSTVCRKLVANGISITDDDRLRICWKNHFANLTQSQVSESESNQDESDVAHMEEDFIFDCPIDIEEIESALKKLKTKRSGELTAC